MILHSYLTRNRPVSLVHFITNKCNARCKHCFIDFDDKNVFKDELNLDEIRKFISHLEPTLQNVNLTGGEPFIHPHLWEIICEYFKKTRIRSVYITTNGFFTDKILEVANKFLNDTTLERKKLIISISIDNFPENHDHNRNVNGLFERALKTYYTLKKLKSKKVLVNINLCVTDTNSDDIQSIYDYLVSKRGITSLTSILIRGIKIDLKTRERVYNGYIKLNSLIDKGISSGLLEGYGDTFFGKVMNVKNVLLHREIATTFKTGKYLSPCYAGLLFCVVCSNGDVYPCEMLPLKMGNLRDFNYNLSRILDLSLSKKIKNFIKETKCHCTYECTWSINILMNPKYALQIASGVASLSGLSNPFWTKEISSDFKEPCSLNYDVNDNIIVPHEHIKGFDLHPVITADHFDTANSSKDKKEKIEKIKNS